MITGKIEKILKWVLVGLILVYPGFFAFQEGDFTDTGFLLTKYRFFIEDLVERRLSSEIMLTTAVGYYWYKIFPHLGILSFKLLYYFFYLLNVGLAYLFLKNWCKKETFYLLVTFIAIIYAERFWNFVFSYDVFGFTLVGYGCYFIFNYLQKETNILKLFFGGMLIGFSIFARLGNAIVLPLILFAFLIHFLFERKFSFKLAVKNSIFIYSCVFIGIFIPILSIFSLLYLNGYFDAFLIGFQSISKSNSHNFYTLFEFYFKDTFQIIKHTLIIWMVFYFVAYSHKLWDTNKHYSIVILLLIILMLFRIYFGFGYRSALKYLVPAITCIPLVFSIISKQKESNRVMSTFFIIITISSSVGSNTGLALKMNYAQIFLFPYSIMIIKSTFGSKLKMSLENVNFTVNFILLMVLVLSLGSRIGWIYQDHSGLLSRFKYDARINNGVYHGIFTTSENKEKIKELNSCNTKLDSTMFVFGHEPILYYFLDKNPPITKYWLMNGVTNEVALVSDLNKVLDEKGSISIVVVKSNGIEFSVGGLHNFTKLFFKNKSVKKIHMGKFYNVYQVSVLHDNLFL
jgi:hypothetical protein